MMCTLLSIGLKPDRCCLFNQDEVPAHSQMAWILNCVTSIGKLNRMTTWKSQLATSKNANSNEEIDESELQLGLLSYPVLQTADIFLYKSTEVPVGDDQEQHIELARSIAKTFNQRFKKNLFMLPKPIFTPYKRILNLRNPATKMSKSLPVPATRILLTDPPDVIRSKILSAVTDSIPHVTYDPINRPGVSNLLDIYAALTQTSSIKDGRFEGKMASELKLELIEVLVEHLRPIQKEYHRLVMYKKEVEEVYSKGAERANVVANETLKEVMETIGLR